jgi:hypothetical protein
MELCESSSSLFESHMYFVWASCLVLLGRLGGLGHIGDSQRVCLKAMSRVTFWTFSLSPACSLSLPQSLPKAPLPLPSVTAQARWWSKLAMMLM